MKTRFCMIALAACFGLMMQVHAQTAAEPVKPVKKLTHHKKAKTAKAETPAAADDEAAPDTSASTATELNCELGRKMTVYRNPHDENQIAVRWKEKLMRFSRVDTQTGANRFENQKQGLVWIGIPSKSMLLDSKSGHQLANECRSADQLQEVSKSKG